MRRYCARVSHNDGVTRLGTGVAQVVGVIGIVLSTAWGLWFTGAAFVGGWVLVPGGRLIFPHGSLLMGFLVLVIGVPLLDLVIYWLCMLVVMVLAIPLAVIAGAGRARTQASEHRPRAATTLGVPTTTAQARVVRIDGGTVTFRRSVDGSITVTANGYGGRPSPQNIRRAKDALVAYQVKNGQAPWFPTTLF